MLLFDFFASVFDFIGLLTYVLGKKNEILNTSAICTRLSVLIDKFFLNIWSKKTDVTRRKSIHQGGITIPRVYGDKNDNKKLMSLTRHCIISKDV